MENRSAVLDQQLDQLLAEGLEGARQREASQFDELTGKRQQDIVLFGAGNLGRRTSAGLRSIGIEPLCFIDNNEARWGESLEGIPVLSPSIGAQRYGAHATFV